AAEIVASYDLDHFFRAMPQRLLVRSLRVAAKVDSGGISFAGLSSDGTRGGNVLSAALLRSMPAVEIDSGQIELATPLGPLTIPLKGSLNPRSDGAVEAAFDLQAQSAHGRFAGTLRAVAADGAVDADLAIVDGTAAIERTLSAAFTGRTKLTWAGKGHPRVSAALDLKEISVEGTAFPARPPPRAKADAHWDW